MRDSDPERGDILLGFAVLMGTLIPAVIVSTIVGAGDTMATRLILYGGAISAAVVIYRQLVKPLTRAIAVILGLDERVERIEQHLGIKP